jgi:indolepyruvate ferredoxin oxidoreductase alpha subunit
MADVLLQGHEAIAQGAWEAGCAIGVGYPGTPSTETLESFAKFPDVYAEWAPNEKVALEVAGGVSLAGKRSLVTMKHVGLNVAADPLFSLANTGVTGGLVILVADDPGIFSSQNEQDSRNYAAAARIPMLEPSDSAEARTMAIRAFDLSERFDIPMMIRSSVRISHTRTPVICGSRIEVERKPYIKNAAKWVMMPANAQKRRIDADTREDALIAFAEETDLNRIEMHDTSMGIICSGADYQHVKEALPHSSILKLGLSWPMPPAKVRAFASMVDGLYVVEEAYPYFDLRVRAMGVDVSLPPVRPLPRNGELTPGIIATSFGIEMPGYRVSQQVIPARPPALCAGCPHRLVFTELRRVHALVTGDIGCYTLGAIPPLSGLDSTVDMGASISMAHGFELAGGADGKPVVAVIGDSTFAHSGITSLLGTVYNQGDGTVLILDNRTTAMTGQQGNPVNGITLQHRPSRELDLVLLVKALGVEDVCVVNPQSLKAVREGLKAALANPKLSVVIFRSPCRLLDRHHEPALSVDQKVCTACGVCVSIGCPALGKSPDTGRAHIDPLQCIGCHQCEQECSFGAIIQPQTATQGEGSR